MLPVAAKVSLGNALAEQTFRVDARLRFFIVQIPSYF
jgi:hypothetical protein